MATSTATRTTATTASSSPTGTIARRAAQAVRLVLSLAPQNPQRGDRGATRPGHVEVGHQRELRHRGLLGAQGGVRADLPQEPVTEPGRGLHHAAADEVGAADR